MYEHSPSPRGRVPFVLFLVAVLLAAAGGAAVAGSVSARTCYREGFADGTADVQDDAIRGGHAEFVATPKRTIEFRWKPRVTGFDLFTRPDSQ